MVLKNGGAKYFVLGADANVELQPGIQEVTGKEGYSRKSCKDYDDRHSAVVSLMQQFRLRATNTWMFCLYGLISVYILLCRFLTGSLTSKHLP